MKIAKLKIRKDSYLLSTWGLFDIFVVVGSVTITVHIAMAIAKLPQAGNLWLALLVGASAVTLGLMRIKSGIRQNRRQHREKQSHSDDAAL